MSFPKPTLFDRILAAAPFVLPALGGGIGITYVNLTPNANPFIWIALGVLIGFGLSHLVNRFADWRDKR